MVTEDINGFSFLASTEERIFLLHILLVAPIAMTIAIYIIISLSKEFKQTDDKNPFRKKTIYCALLSVSGSILIYMGYIFFNNDLIIPWNYKDHHYHLATINDAINATFYFIAKISFYYSLTFHIQSIHGSSLFLTIWMIIIGLILIILGMIFGINDAMEYSMKETAITERRHIYLAMYLSHDGADLAKIAFIICIIVDFIYFAVLIYVYSIRIKSAITTHLDKETNVVDGYIEEGIKPVVLVVFASIIFWVMSMSIAFNWKIKWIIGTFDILSDDICMYFMIVTDNQQLYYTLFRFVHVCIGKIIFGKKYQIGQQKYEMISINNDEDVA